MQILPFSGDVLSLAVDEVLDQFEGLGIADPAGSIATHRIAAAGATCIATLVVVEIARRFHPTNSEKDDRRVPSVAMIPALRSSRSS